MKKLLFLTFLAVVVLAVPVTSEAQMRWGVRAGITDGEPMIGTDLAIPLAGDFVANPSIEFTSELFSANADFHYDFDINANSAFWVGAGLAFLNPDDGDFEGGVNLLGGYGFRRNNLYPYAQVRFTSASDIDDFATIAVGVRF